MHIDTVIIHNDQTSYAKYALEPFYVFFFLGYCVLVGVGGVFVCLVIPLGYWRRKKLDWDKIDVDKFGSPAEQIPDPAFFCQRLVWGRHCLGKSGGEQQAKQDTRTVLLPLKLLRERMSLEQNPKEEQQCPLPARHVNHPRLPWSAKSRTFETLRR